MISDEFGKYIQSKPQDARDSSKFGFYFFVEQVVIIFYTLKDVHIMLYNNTVMVMDYLN